MHRRGGRLGAAARPHRGLYHNVREMEGAIMRYPHDNQLHRTYLRLPCPKGWTSTSSAPPPRRSEWGGSTRRRGSGCMQGETVALLPAGVPLGELILPTVTLRIVRY